MIAREECLRALTEMVRSGDIGQGGPVAGRIGAYLATLPDRPAQLAALEDLRTTLAELCNEAGVAGAGEERHVGVEDALDEARTALEEYSGPQLQDTEASSTIGRAA